MNTNDTPIPSSTPSTEASDPAAGRCAVASGSAEPLRQAYSHQESVNIAMQWMRDNYGIAKDLPEDTRDRYHEKLGLLVDFLWTLHPPESSSNDKISNPH
jgi:hypothetical protein